MLNVELDRAVERSPVGSSRFYSEVASRVAEATRADAESDVRAAPVDLLARLEQARPGKRRAILHERVRGEAMKVLGLGPSRRWRRTDRCRSSASTR